MHTLIMDKFLLQHRVLERLAEDLLQVEQAVRAAHETATHEESIAENKYDTLGLEAAYLATGQARRADGRREVRVGEVIKGRLFVSAVHFELVGHPHRRDLLGRVVDAPEGAVAVVGELDVVAADIADGSLELLTLAADAGAGACCRPQRLLELGPRRRGRERCRRSRSGHRRGRRARA